MPQYTSSFRNNIRRERFTDFFSSREISINLTDYGIVSTTDIESNGNLVKRAYSDIINRVYDPNVIVQLNVPAGDYYFRGDVDPNKYIVFEPPQGGQVKIVGANQSGTRPLSTTLASQTKAQNYTTIASHWQTRFHFSVNGIYYKSQFGGTYGVGGFSNIAFFGTWGGSPTNQISFSSINCRGIAGNLRLENCAIHGFNGTTGDSCGIIAEGTSISHYAILISNCGRGIQANGGGNCNGSSPNTDSARDIIVNCDDHGLLALENSTIKMGDGAHIRNTGGYGAYAYDCSSIVVRNSSFSGNTRGSVFVYPGTNSIIHTSTVY